MFFGDWVELFRLVFLTWVFFDLVIITCVIHVPLSNAVFIAGGDEFY